MHKKTVNTKIILQQNSVVRRIQEQIGAELLNILEFQTVLLLSSFKYNQQDATFYSILYYCLCSTRFGQFLRPSSGAQELYTQHLVCARLACCYH